MDVRFKPAGRDGVYRWSVVPRPGAAAVAKSRPEPYRTLEACVAAIRQIKQKVRDAPVDGSAGGTGGVRFRIQRSGAKWQWRLLSGSRTLAVSARLYARERDARTAARTFRDGAPDALIDLPIVKFTIPTTPVLWGAPVDLVATPPGSFGPTAGSVRLLGVDRPTQTQQLPVVAWTTTKISVRLPATPSFVSPTYAVRVETPTLQGEAVLAAAPVALAFTVGPDPAAWGGSIVFTALPPTTFGDTGGEIHLLGVDRAAQSQPLQVQTWTPTVAVARLPATIPFISTSYVVALTRMGMRGEALLPVASVVDALQSRLHEIVERIRVEPAEVTTAPTEGKVTAAPRLEDLPPATVTVPNLAPVPIHVQVSWSASGEEQWTPRLRNPTGAAAEYLLVPQPIRRGQAPPKDDRTLSAHVVATVRSGDDIVAQASKTLDVPVHVQPLEIPQFLVLFNHSEFRTGLSNDGTPGCILILVEGDELPNASVRDITDKLRVAFVALKAAAQRIPSLPGDLPPRLPWLDGVEAAADRIAMLAQAVGTVIDQDPGGEQKGTKLRVRNHWLKRLWGVGFYWDGLYHHTAENSLSSMLLLGLPGDAATIYNNIDHRTNEGVLTIRIPPRYVHVAVRTLHEYVPVTEPAAVVLVAPPTAGTFGDHVSSVHLGPIVPT